MRVTAQFFSQLKDLAGTSEWSVELPADSRVADLLTQLYEKFPDLKKWDANILIGAGVDFVGRDHRLQPNESIAIMPPVQGG